jgi:hypothetical protein
MFGVKTRSVRNVFQKACMSGLIVLPLSEGLYLAKRHAEVVKTQKEP